MSKSQELAEEDLEQRPQLEVKLPVIEATSAWFPEHLFPDDSVDDVSPPTRSTEGASVQGSDLPYLHHPNSSEAILKSADVRPVFLRFYWMTFKSLQMADFLIMDPRTRTPSPVSLSLAQHFTKPTNTGSSVDVGVPKRKAYTGSYSDSIFSLPTPKGSPSFLFLQLGWPANSA